MGVISYEMEVTSSIAAAKMFKAFVLDSDSLTPKILPQVIQSIEIVEGDGGPGTIKKINFSQGNQLKYMKQQVDGIDKENLTYNYSVIEGESLTSSLEKISSELKFVPSADGGCVFKSTSKYYTVGDGVVNEENIKAGKEKALGIFKAIEAYLLANPHA